MLKGKRESVFSGNHMDNVPKETHVASVMTSKPLYTVAKVRDEKGDRLLLHPIRRQNRLMARDKNPHRDQENSFDKIEIPCRFKFCTNPLCKFWHLPVCLNYKSEKGCAHGDKCHFRHVEAEGKPNKKKSKKSGAKGSVASLRESFQLGCEVNLQILNRENLSILRESGKLGSKHTVKVSKSTWHLIKIRERKGPSRSIIQKCAPHERGRRAAKFEERSHEETLHKERCARKAAWDLAKHVYKLKNSHKTMFYVPGEVKAMPPPTTSRRPEEREFVVDSGASMHMMSKKEISSEEMGTVERSRNPTVVLTANGEVHTHEEAHVFVHDLNQFVTVQLLEETPAVLSLGELCKDQRGQWSRATIDQRREKHYLQSGLDESWWSDSMECYCFLRNVQDFLAAGKTPYERRFGEPFRGSIVPFGAMVECHPTSRKDQARIHQFGKKVLPGIFLGHELIVWGFWNGDIWKADLEDLENWMHQMFILKESTQRKY